MPLTDLDKERVRYHLGYLNVSSAPAMAFGLIKPITPIFMIETAMQNLLEIACPRVLQHLAILDNIEERMQAALSRLAVEAADGMRLRDGEPDRLEREYVRWSSRLANQLGVPKYAFSERTNAGVKSGNIPRLR